MTSNGLQICCQPMRSYQMPIAVQPNCFVKRMEILFDCEFILRGSSLEWYLSWKQWSQKLANSEWIGLNTCEIHLLGVMAHLETAAFAAAGVYGFSPSLSLVFANCSISDESRTVHVERVHVAKTGHRGRPRKIVDYDWLWDATSAKRKISLKVLAVLKMKDWLATTWGKTVRNDSNCTSQVW